MDDLKGLIDEAVARKTELEGMRDAVNAVNRKAVNLPISEEGMAYRETCVEGVRPGRKANPPQERGKRVKRLKTLPRICAYAKFRAASPCQTL